MKLNKIKLILTLGLFVLNVQANTKVYKVGSKNFKIDIPNSWQVAQNFLGSDLSILGEVKDNRRPVIAFSSIPLGDYKFKKEELEASQNDYYEGRRKWIKKNNGKVNSFYSYLEVSWDNIQGVHSIGYNYNLGKLNFIEYNYFFKCNKKTFTLSTLVTDKQLKTSKKEIHKVLNSIKCLL
jgi:hypothetical protein